MTGTSFETPNTIPLTGWQKTRLIFDCVPLVVIVVLFAIYLLVVQDGVGAAPVAFYIFALVVILVLGFRAVQRCRDLISGVAVVEEDVLERSWHSGGGARGLYFGRFERLGRLRIIAKAHFQSHNQMRYRVIYSPVSKIVWQLESLE